MTLMYFAERIIRYRLRAEEARDMRDHAISDGLRTVAQEMSDHYDEMADFLEKSLTLSAQGRPN